MNKRRVGRFLINRDLIDNRSGEIVEMFHALKILVVRAEMRYESNSIEYVGISPSFEDIGQGFEAPLYFIAAETNPETPGAYKYTLTKA